MHVHTLTHTCTTHRGTTNGRNQSYVHCSVAIMGLVVLEFLK